MKIIIENIDDYEVCNQMFVYNTQIVHKYLHDSSIAIFIDALADALSEWDKYVDEMRRNDEQQNE